MTSLTKRPPTASAAAPLSSPKKDDRPISARMSDLLRRYPDLEEDERNELIDFIRRGHPDHFAEVVYGRGLLHKVVLLKDDHPAHFSRGLRAWLPWILLSLIVVAATLLAARLV